MSQHEPTAGSVADTDGPSRRLVAFAVVVAALLVLAAVAAVALDVREGDHSVSPSPTTTAVDLDELHRDAATDFLAAWHRWRTTDLVARGQLVRTRPDGERLESDAVVAQQGEIRIVGQLGGATGFDGTDRLRCVTESDGVFRCDRTAVGTTADERLGAELDQWAEYFSGSPPYYRIGHPEDSLPGLACYELVITVANLAADFGSVARFCFVPETGALAQARIEYSNGLIETTEYSVVELGEIDDSVFDQLLAEPVS